MPQLRFVLTTIVLTLVACKEPAPDKPLSPAIATVTAAATATATARARSLPAGTHDPPRVALGTEGAVASQEAHATDVGIAILKRGGNAVDAAIGVAFALAATHPSAGNIGGGGFMVVRMADGTSTAIDYREVAPKAASRDMYIGANGEVTRDSLVGAKAAGIPGTVAGLALAHERFGKLAWKDLVAPAVKLAEGHVIDAHHAEDLTKATARMRAEGLTSSAALFEKAGGGAWTSGDTFSQPALAVTLRAIADGGARAFYEGPVAKKMVDEIRRGGGIWSLDDLVSYRAVARAPITFTYRGHEIVSMPPPSGGGVVLRQMLGAAALHELADQPSSSLFATHVYVESARRAYADRNLLLADPDHAEVPLSELLDEAYVNKRMASIDVTRATPSSRVRAGVGAAESEETTHFSIVDRHGNAVSNTYTLNTGFGAKLILGSVGVLLNNEMDDFSAKPGSANVYGLVQSEPNAIAPGKRMLSSMTPTIVSKDGAVRLVVGSPGGPTITTTVVQIIRRVIDDGMTLDAAVAAPRIHHQWLPDRVFLEEGVPKALRDGLTGMGHTVELRPPIGHANCVEVDAKSRGFRAVADFARDGGKAAAF